MKEEMKRILKLFENGAGFSWGNQSGDYEYDGKGANKDSKKTNGGEKITHLVAYDKKSFQNAHLLCGILNYLPSAYKDIENLSAIVLEQQGTIVELQKQIKYLSAVIETVALGRIQIEMGKELHTHIKNLANESNMYEQDGGEIILKVSSSMFNEKNKDTTENLNKGNSDESINDSLKKVKASVGGILGKIANLELSGEMKDKTNEALMSYLNTLSKIKDNQIDVLESSGEAIYKYGKIKCDPSIKIIDKLTNDKHFKLTKDIITEIKKNPHNEK
jgi:hypothetical protein